jgi:hypothetical protein
MLAVIGKHQHGKTENASLAKAKVEVKGHFLSKLSVFIPAVYSFFHPESKWINRLKNAL